MGCNASPLSSTCLGVLFIRWDWFQSPWNPVTERMEKKLATWKSRYLSSGGQITLIKAVLSNLSIYFLQSSSVRQQF